MARKVSSAPWLHKSSGFWCSTLAGKRVYLSKDRESACRALQVLRGNPERTQDESGSEWHDQAFVSLADLFLFDAEHRVKKSTFTGYRFRLLRALKILGPEKRVGDIGKNHLAEIEHRMIGEYSQATIRDTIAILQAVFSWAVKNNLLSRDPLAGYEKPVPERRSRTRCIPISIERLKEIRSRIDLSIPERT